MSPLQTAGIQVLAHASACSTVQVPVAHPHCARSVSQLPPGQAHPVIWENDPRNCSWTSLPANSGVGGRRRKKEPCHANSTNVKVKQMRAGCTGGLAVHVGEVDSREQHFSSVNARIGGDQKRVNTKTVITPVAHAKGVRGK